MPLVSAAFGDVAAGRAAFVLRPAVGWIGRSLRLALGASVEPNSAQAEIERLKSQIAAIEARIAQQTPAEWPPRDYYATYHVLAGMVLGLFGALASLLFNVIGAAMVGRHPLELIRVYLTFPLGEGALKLESGFALAAGCCLYLATGMILGVPFHLVFSRYLTKSSGFTRFIVATLLALAIWIINFYAVIGWVQPLLIGGRWILERVPMYVAISTHLVFGWTMLLLDQWGHFVPYRVSTPESRT